MEENKGKPEKPNTEEKAQISQEPRVSCAAQDHDAMLGAHRQVQGHVEREHDGGCHARAKLPRSRCCDRCDRRIWTPRSVLEPAVCGMVLFCRAPTSTAVSMASVLAANQHTAGMRVAVGRLTRRQEAVQGDAATLRRRSTDV